MVHFVLSDHRIFDVLCLRYSDSTESRPCARCLLPLFPAGSESADDYARRDREGEPLRHSRAETRGVCRSTGYAPEAVQQDPLQCQALPYSRLVRQRAAAQHETPDPSKRVAVPLSRRGVQNPPLHPLQAGLAHQCEPLQRARLLPAYVEIMLAAGDVSAARVAAGGLARCFLTQFGIEVFGFVRQVGESRATNSAAPMAYTVKVPSSLAESLIQWAGA